MTLALVLGAVLAAAAPPPGAAEAVRGAADRAAADLARSVAALPARGGVRVIACGEFAEAAPYAGLGRVAADAAAARLAAGLSVEVLDHAKLEAILGEQRLSAMLGAGPADAALLKKAGAQAILTGRIDDAAGRPSVSLRLVGAQGAPLASATAAAATPAASAVPLPPPPGKAGVESPRVEVAIRRLSDGLAAGFARLPGNARYRRLAVLGFSEVGEEATRRKMGTIVTAEIATTLRRDHGLLLVERARLAEVLGELQLQQMISVDAASAGKVGAMADAQALVIGSVADAGDRFLVNARIVATQSGETLAAESSTVPAAGLVALASDAVVLRSRSGAVFRSLLVPGFGQFYNRQPAKGFAFIGAEVALLGTALGFHLAGNAAYDDYRAVGAGAGGSPSQRATFLYDTAASRYNTRNWLLVGAAAVWALNVVDAYASGVDGEAVMGGGGAARSARVAPAVLPGPDGAVVALTGRF